MNTTKEVRSAQQDVQDHRERLDRALSEFEGKIRGTATQVRGAADRIRRLNDSINAPFSRVRDNPLPVAILCATLGYIVGSKIQERYGDRLGVDQLYPGREPGRRGRHLSPVDRDFPSTPGSEAPADPSGKLTESSIRFG